MQPEDIDKLFRDRLEGHAPTPPAYLWNQLEAEIQPKRKRPVMWLAAAAVALLTLLGGAWMLLVQQGPTSGLGAGAVASVTKKSPAKKSAATQATPASPSPSTTSEAQNEAAPTEVAISEASAARPEGVQPAPAAETRRTGLGHSQAPRSTPAQPQKAMLAAAPSRQAVAPATPAPTAPEQRAVAVALPAEVDPATNTLALATAAKSVPMGPIEVEVRPSTVATALATSDASDYGRRPRLGALLQQARNAVRGDKVSLTDAGLPEVVTVEARLGNRTLTKVIQL
ncbi:hypothetical protein SAMN06265337_0761 [Hymenobacter gelipurpurascens]|uniref:Uncharacterized protein n=1 Tax=Hymenobacter gelipurpurascens TaxID=89968 RepID=A0A212TA61_9BACT|nr:hypothetical protein [Hymenobacter gelipurpurascens]SNC62885.1 hypothetical protein SAMN06265337_0761 [Hymenobacter gelipurpurascens]